MTSTFSRWAADSGFEGGQDGRFGPWQAALQGLSTPSFSTILGRTAEVATRAVVAKRLEAGTIVLMVNAKGRAARAGALLLGLSSWAMPLMAEDDSDENWYEDIEADEEKGRLRGETLAFVMPRSRIAEDLPPLRFVPGFQIALPYQVLGIGTSIELVPVGWLRIGTAYAFGMSSNGVTTAWGNYGEGFLGIRVFGASSEAAADIPIRDRKPMRWRDPPAIKAWVPAHNRIFVEAGVITALLSLRHCATEEECEQRFGTATGPSEERQLVIPAGGLRYVHYYSIRSERTGLGRSRMFQAYLHVLIKSINAGDPRSHFITRIAGGQPLGARLGVEAHSGFCPAQFLFATGCATYNLALGYAPYPEFLLFEFRVGYPVYP